MIHAKPLFDMVKVQPLGEFSTALASLTPLPNARLIPALVLMNERRVFMVGTVVVGIP